MNKLFSSSTNAEGSVIVVVMMVLTLLIIVGLASIRTATTEIEIAGAELIHQRNFYLAEGAAMQAVRWLDNNALAVGNGPSWMEMTPNALDGDNIDDYWEGKKPNKPKICDVDDDADFIAAYEGVAAGSSLDVNKT